MTPDAIDAWLNKPGLTDQEILARLKKKTREQEGPLDTPCWIWKGRRNKRGYGLFFPNNDQYGKKLVHRLGYRILIGDIPPGMELDHLCEVRRCWRPNHLEVVTPQENSARVFKARPYRPARRLVV